MTKVASAVFLSATLIIAALSCKKPGIEIPTEPPFPIETKSYVQFSTNGVQLTGTQYHALVSIKKSSGEEVVSNKKITLNYVQGTYITDKIALDKTDYRLSKFIVLGAADSAIYATPKAGTSKASQVNYPIDISFSITQNVVKSVPVEVVKITDADAAANFGYTDSDFGFLSTLTVRVKLKINVGQVAYDNLQGKLVVTATGNQGRQWSREIDLQKGFTNVRVPENFDSYQFQVAKWNVAAHRNIAGSAIQPGMLVELEASRAPKRLIEEETFIESAGNFNPDSRAEYFYNSAGSLSEIKDYQKSVQVSGLPLTNIYRFTYNNSFLESINRFSPDQTNTGHTSFYYDAGRLSFMINKSYDQETSANIFYNNADGVDKIKATYLYHNGSSIIYNMKFNDGNKISDDAASSNNGGETGIYSYDDYINPKYQLGYPDLYFSNVSKNNIVNQQKSFAGAIPQSVPYKYEYVYNTDGYPTEVFVSYKGYTSQQHLYRIKKTFKYQ
jgi:hypothetical protein